MQEKGETRTLSLKDASLGFANHIRIHFASGHNGCCDAEDPLSIVKITPSSPYGTPEDTASRKTISGKNIGRANAFHTPFVFLRPFRVHFAPSPQACVVTGEKGIDIC